MKRLSLLLGILMPLYLSAQDIKLDTEEIEKRCIEQIAQLNDYIQFISDPSKSLKVREKYCGETLNLFIGNGEAYEVETSDGEKIQKGPVVMEIFSTLRRKSVIRPVKSYLTALMNLRYSRVEIRSVEVVTDYDMSTLHMLSDNLYTCDGWIDKAFVGYRDGMPLYKDISRKKIMQALLLLKNEDGTFDAYPKLGNIVAIDINK